MIPVILSGGSGTRLWPVSRSKYPKQFADLFAESLFTKTLKRLKVLGTPWALTTKELTVLTERCYGEVGLKPVAIYEPFGKNTAPAIGVLCHILNLKGHSNDVVGVFPADHFIEDESTYIGALRLAESIASTNVVVTIGIKPTYPATGFGYIETSSKEIAKSTGGLVGFRAVGFREKPDTKTAQEFINSGNFFWNAGNFIFKVSHMIKLFEKHLPDMWATIQTLKPDCSNIEDVYKAVQNVSIDYAIMEKLEEHVCIPCDIGWNDVGSWDEVSKIRETTTDVVQVEASNNFVLSQGAKLYAFVEASDLLVIETSDAVLIAKKGSSQKVKDVVEKLKKSDKSQHANILMERNFDIRPWGSYEILRDSENYKSKVIHVNPGHQLSYQSHTKRAEHWVITKGNPEVVLNDKTYQLKPGESIYIPQGAKHRMRNTTNDIVEFIEVQVGTYFGEDDITRYQDDYNR